MQDKNKKIYFTSRLAQKYLDALKYVCEKERRPLTNQLAIVVEDWLEKNQDKYPEIKAILKDS